jgi:hypothetical protein
MTEERRIVYESHTAVHKRNAQFVQNSTVTKYQIFILWNVLDECIVLVSISSYSIDKGRKRQKYVSILMNSKRTKESGVSITQADKAL